MLSFAGEPFTRGRSRFLDRVPEFRESTAKVFVRIRFPDLARLSEREEPPAWFAQVDTGSAWPVLNCDVARGLGVLDGDGDPAAMSTRLGRFAGRLERLRVSLLADEGESVEFEATFFVSRDWLGPTFLGYSGFLDRIRTAIDPSSNSFFFGPLASPGLG
jgi:hypothetical protein